MWLEEHSKFTKESTFARYKSKTNQILKQFSGQKITQIHRIDIQRYINELADSYSLSTVSKSKIILKQIFDYACKNDFLSKNPCSYIKIPACKIKPKPKAYMEKEELFKFLNYAKCNCDSIFFTIFMTLAYTGMRCGELSALRWSDVDFKEKIISITHTLYYTNKNQYKLTLPKTRRSMRKISISDELVEELKRHQYQQKLFRILNANTYSDKNFVFADKNGIPLFNYAIYNKCKSISQKLGLNNIHPHSFRHTHTSLLAEARVSLEVIQERLGHSNDSITKEIYLHITQNLKSEAAEKFSALMNGYKMVTK
jgi:integrase